MSESLPDIVFKCRRPPSLNDWFWGIFFAAIVFSQAISMLREGGYWIIGSSIWLWVGWLYFKAIRDRLRSDLVLARHQMKFIDSRKALEKVHYSTVLKLTEGPAHLKILHKNENMRSSRPLTLHRHSFHPTEWETLARETIKRVRTRAPDAEIDTLSTRFPP